MSTDDARATVVDPDPDLSVEDEYDDVADPDSPSHRRSAGKHKRSGLVEWIIVVVVAISSALLVRAYVLQQFAVEGTSMLNTLHPSDRVLVNKLSYRLHDPRRGDVVVLKRIESNAQERDLIKRVVALPGETIEYRDCQLFIDGTLVNEPYLDPQIVVAESLRGRSAGCRGRAEARLRDGRQPRWLARQPRQPASARSRTATSSGAPSWSCGPSPTGSGCNAASGRTWPTMIGGRRRLTSSGSIPLPEPSYDADPGVDLDVHSTSDADPVAQPAATVAADGTRRSTGSSSPLLALGGGVPAAHVRRAAVRRRRRVDARHPAVRRSGARQQAQLRPARSPPRRHRGAEGHQGEPARSAT